MNFKYQHRASDKHEIDTYRRLNAGYLEESIICNCYIV